MRQRSVATVSPLAAAIAYGRVLAAAGCRFDPGVVDALEHGVRDESLGLLRQRKPAAAR